MSPRLLLTAFAAAHVIGGLGCVMAPNALVGSFGVELPPMGLVIYQFWGASMAAVGALIWLLRDAWSSGIPTRFVAVLVGLNVLNAVIAVRGQFAGANAAGWTMVFSYAFFGLAFLFVAIRSERQPKS